MKPFNTEKPWVYPNVNLWTQDIIKCLKRLNSFYMKSNGVILDIGGGLAPISEISNLKSYEYILVDPDVKKLNLAPSVIDKRKGYGEKVPVDDNSADIIVTSSCLQYMEQSKFFEECHRVLKPGGFIAVHENGPKNPIILLARLMQRIIGLFNKKHWHYRNSIKKYYSPREVEGFKIIYINQSGLLTPTMLFLQYLNLKQPLRLYKALLWLDEKLLRILPFLKELTFLSTVIYIKV